MKLSTYLSESKEELRHVSWPTKKQTTLFTILVIAVSVIVATYLGFFDYIFSLILGNFF